MKSDLPTVGRTKAGGFMDRLQRADQELKELANELDVETAADLSGQLLDIARPFLLSLRELPDAEPVGGRKVYQWTVLVDDVTTDHEADLVAAKISGMLYDNGYGMVYINTERIDQLRGR